MEVDESPEVTTAGEAVPAAEVVEAVEAAPKVDGTPTAVGSLRSILSAEELEVIPGETTKKIETYYEQKLEEFLTAKALLETAKTNVGKRFVGGSWGCFFGVIFCVSSRKISHCCKRERRKCCVFFFLFAFFLRAGFTRRLSRVNSFGTSLGGRR